MISQHAKAPPSSDVSQLVLCRTCKRTRPEDHFLKGAATCRECLQKKRDEYQRSKIIAQHSASASLESPAADVVVTGAVISPVAAPAHALPAPRFAGKLTIELGFLSEQEAVDRLCRLADEEKTTFVRDKNIRDHQNDIIGAYYRCHCHGDPVTAQNRQEREKQVKVERRHACAPAAPSIVHVRLSCFEHVYSFLPLLFRSLYRVIHIFFH